MERSPISNISGQSRSSSYSGSRRRRYVIDMTNWERAAGSDGNTAHAFVPTSYEEQKYDSCALIDHGGRSLSSPGPSRNKNQWTCLTGLFGALRERRSLHRLSNSSKAGGERSQAGIRSGSRKESEPFQQTSASGWLKRATSTRFRRHRLSSTSTLYHTPGTIPVISHTTIPRPEVRPGSSGAPRNPVGGAAARAAAAAQNEAQISARSLTLRDSSRLAEPKVNTDTESGVGIEIRDQPDEVEFTFPVTRTDPSLILPEELMTHIMSYLDAASLMEAELVSSRWYGTANSYHTWRHVFCREHSLPHLSSTEATSASHIGGLGLGKRRPDQDWKGMWKVRKMLHARWQEARAAAIYLEGHKDSVYCVQFDENKILTGSRDRTIRIWDAHTYECIKVLGVPKTNSESRIYDPRPNLATRGQKPTVSIVPARPLSELLPVEKPLIYHHGSILCLQFDLDIMVTGSSDHTCIIWDIKQDYQSVRRLSHHRAGVLDVCFNDKHIVSCSKDTTICLWDRQSGELLRTLAGHRGPVNAVQLRGDLIVSASGDGIAKLWNLRSGLCIKEFPSKGRGLACVEFSPDSRTILAGGNDQVIYHFDANSGELIRELQGHKDLVRSLHLDSTNSRVISGSYDTSVKAYDLNTGDLLCDFEGWTTSWMLSAKADYRRIVATSQDSRAIIMDFGYALPGIELLEG